MVGDIEALNDELGRLRRTAQLLESLMRLAQHPDVATSDARDEALEIVAELTRSEAAFLFVVNQADGTLESGTWSSGIGGSDRRIVIAEAGDWAQVASSGEVLVAGEGPLDQAATRGLDYPGAVHRFVSSPIVAQGDVVAVGGVLNKRSPYSEADRRRVSMLMHSTWAILDHKRAQRVLRDLAFDDALTGLANRARFDQLLRIEVRRADRAGLPLGVVVADLDSFAAYNAVEGRSEGDRVLRRVADALRESFQRAGEVAARLEDDLFAVVLPATDASEIGRAGTRAREAVAALSIAHPSSDTAQVITASVGIAVHEPRSGDSADALLATALLGIEESRGAGGNLVGRQLPEL